MNQYQFTFEQTTPTFTVPVRVFAASITTAEVPPTTMTTAQREVPSSQPTYDTRYEVHQHPYNTRTKGKIATEIEIAAPRNDNKFQTGISWQGGMANGMAIKNLETN